MQNCCTKETNSRASVIVPDRSTRTKGALNLSSCMNFRIRFNGTLANIHFFRSRLLPLYTYCCVKHTFSDGCGLILKISRRAPNIHASWLRSNLIRRALSSKGCGVLIQGLDRAKWISKITFVEDLHGHGSRSCRNQCLDQFCGFGFGRSCVDSENQYIFKIIKYTWYCRLTR